MASEPNLFAVLHPDGGFLTWGYPSRSAAWGVACKRRGSPLGVRKLRRQFVRQGYECVPVVVVPTRFNRKIVRVSEVSQ